MKSILFIALTLAAIFSADLNGRMLYGTEEQSLCSLFSDTEGNADNENVLSDEDTSFFSSLYIFTQSICGFPGRLVSKTILTFSGSVFKPPKYAFL